MQSVSSRIWTRVAVSISYDSNHYTTGRNINSYYSNTDQDSQEHKINVTMTNQTASQFPFWGCRSFISLSLCEKKNFVGTYGFPIYFSLYQPQLVHPVS